MSMKITILPLKTVVNFDLILSLYNLMQEHLLYEEFFYDIVLGLNQRPDASINGLMPLSSRMSSIS